MFGKKGAYMNKNLIIYGGAFNPPTIAHLEIGKFIRNKFNDKELVYLPTNDFYNKDSLASFEDRVNMLELLIKKIDDKVSISKYELENDSYKGTYYTLIHFNHPYFVIGADSLENLGKWINGTKLVEENNFIVFPRSGYDVNEIISKDKLLFENKDHFVIISEEEFEKSDVSSTSFRNGKDDSVLIEEINEYIKLKGLYR